MTRVLVVSSEPVGERIAGPAIRSLELARVLSASCDVTLSAPEPSSVADPGVRLLEAGLADFSALAEAIDASDVVVAQTLPAQLLRQLARSRARHVADLYNVLPVEGLEAGADGELGPARRSHHQTVLSSLAQCAAADLVLCASERQRDFWLGAMALQGLIDVESYRRDPSYRSFVEVVPFGVSEDEPQPGEPRLKGVLPGVEAGDRVLLWAGGIWSWLDALTPIRALERLRADGVPAHLVFLGVERPSIEPERTPSAAGAALGLARERGLDGAGVHFLEGWVPYEQRGAYLLEADLGVSAHREHLESRFSFRTRLLDHLWAGLPTVASSGDELADRIDAEGAGSTVAAGNDEAFAAACRSLLEDGAAHERASAAARTLADSLRWSQVAQPLVDYCNNWNEREPPRKSRLALGLGTYGQYPYIAADLRERRGAGELLRRARWYAERLFKHGAR